MYACVCVSVRVCVCVVCVPARVLCACMWVTVWVAACLRACVPACLCVCCVNYLSKLCLHGNNEQVSFFCKLRCELGVRGAK